MKLQIKIKKMREKEILDYHHLEINGEDNENIKKEKKIISITRQNLQRNYAFYYYFNMLVKGIGKVLRESIQLMIAEMCL